MPTIEQLKAEHEGEWLAINVTASDYYGATEGELLYHSNDHDEVWRKIGEIPREKRKDYDIKVCYARPPLSEGVNMFFFPEKFIMERSVLHGEGTGHSCKVSGGVGGNRNSQG